MGLIILLSPILAFWAIQAGVSIHRTMMREHRRTMPTLYGNDNKFRVWLGF